jgi:hypothetical protein
MDKALVTSSVLVAAALTGIFLTSGYAQGDQSETNTEQSIAQKNVGSGESTNNNCAPNSIDATLAASDFTRVAPPPNTRTVACPVTSGVPQK